MNIKNQNKHSTKEKITPEIKLFGRYSISPINLILQIVWLIAWVWKVIQDLQTLHSYENPLLVYSIGMIFWIFVLYLGIYVMTCLLYTSPSPRDNTCHLVCRLLL
ncbi:hypothetical protein, partial [Acinetobacter baumannii]|uniref:hypothetical protein n=3 Tax=Acinetobacter baumannii TaxID=470 RepID=UPI003AFA7AB7